MDKDEVVVEFRRALCDMYGYDLNLKFVGTAKSRQTADESKTYLGPRDFLNYAIQDSLALEDERNRINCLGNCKRAIDSQVNRIIGSVGFFPLARKQRWSIPRKLDFLAESGFVAPRILRRLNQLRNNLEHEFDPPSREQVEDALDIATLFISYAELIRTPALNWTLSGKLSVRYDYDDMSFRFFETDPSDFLEGEIAPLLSLAYGEDGFQELYDFLVRVVPLMEARHRLGEDI